MNEVQVIIAVFAGFAFVPMILIGVVEIAFSIFSKKF